MGNREWGIVEGLRRFQKKITEILAGRGELGAGRFRVSGYQEIRD